MEFSDDEDLILTQNSTRSLDEMHSLCYGGDVVDEDNEMVSLEADNVILEVVNEGLSAHKEIQVADSVAIENILDDKLIDKM